MEQEGEDEEEEEEVEEEVETEEEEKEEEKEEEQEEEKKYSLGQLRDRQGLASARAPVVENSTSTYRQY